MHRRSALIALLAILLHAFAPLLASASPQAAADHMELCTASGVITVPIDADGAPAGAPATPEHCPACAFQSAVAVAMPVAQAPHAASAQAVFTRLPQPRGTSTPTGARPRAPPQYS